MSTITTPNGKINLRLWSDDVPIGELTEGGRLVTEHVHVKGAPVKLANGQFRASKAMRHYVSFKNADLSGVNDANARIREILDALQGSQLAKMIISGSVEAEIDLAAFHGEIAWEEGIDPSLLAHARAANVRIVVEHYDKFTDKGAPLAVTL